MEDQQNAVKAVRLMHDYTVSLGIPESYNAITVHLYHDLDSMINAYARVLQAHNNLTSPPVESSRNVWTEMGTIGATGSMGVFIYLGHPTIQEDPQFGYPFNLIRIVSGELLGAQMSRLSALKLSAPFDEVPEAGPQLIGAGFSGFLGAMARSEAGVKPYDEYRKWLVRSVRNMDPPLSDMETLNGFRATGGTPYQYSALAAELLASHAGAGALLQYYANHERGTPWQETFKNTFGMTVDEFYQLFEEHRAAGFPKLEIPK